ncbi:MAG: 4-alpha-glucanotransferase [Spirochaetaceae bacterium]|jgi:4-alpha-glucanotransferase|nr:4-alpha-glucanotransferase [Spirochaetaceae bacterium]
MADAMTNKRLIGVVVPVGALRSKNGIGVGEFPDLVDFARFCKKTDIGLIQILPVNDTGYESSPYSALSAFALNPLYLRIQDMEEAQSYESELDAIKVKFSNEIRFPYYKMAKAKMELLRKIFKENFDKIERDTTLSVWIKKNEWVKTYSVFRRLKEANEEKSWKEWKAFQKVNTKDIEALWNDPLRKSENLFWAWLQSNLEKQFKAAAEAVAAMDIILKGDIPILMNLDSCDVWSHPEYFHQSLSAGAPPDMYSPEGQNWGFPIYNWTAQAKDDYIWWRARIKAAEKYYKAFRIDHVLGFFRIWATSRCYNSATMGRFIPYVPIKKQDLQELGFDDARIRWLTLPHIPTHEVWDALHRQGGCTENEVHRVFELALDRIGSEELWLFKKTIKYDANIEALNIPDVAKNFLIKELSARVFLEYDTDVYSCIWTYQTSRQYASLSDKERECLEKFLAEKHEIAEKRWEKDAKKILSVLTEGSSMVACAEDLGVQTECVPRILNKLKIFSLKVVRWEHDWSLEGHPYIPYGEYPELSVCTTSVHDSTTLRQWWNDEADQELFAAFNGAPSLPKSYNPGTARIFLRQAASARSRWRILPLIDMLHLTPRWYAEDPDSERINIPGTSNEFNWTWRLPADIEELEEEKELISAIKELSAVPPASSQKKSADIDTKQA